MKYVFKKRNESVADPAAIERMAKEFGVSHLLAELLCVRGILADTGAFLNPDIRNMADSHLLRDMKKAVELVRSHIENKNKIVVFADYDSDGVNAAVILYLTLKKMQADVQVYLPRRAEGYGLSVGAVNKIAGEGAKLLITADCGISNIEEIRLAKELVMDVVLTDHHECPATLPGADAILNPKREGETYPFRELCGGGVVFKLACALLGREAFELIDFAAVATIGDVVPLVN
ncbi:MAG: DHH family phosphoesterase, partial [Eubacteriales bacterium]